MERFQAIENHFSMNKKQIRFLAIFFIAILAFSVSANSEKGSKGTQNEITGEWTADFKPGSSGEKQITFLRRSTRHGLRTEGIRLSPNELQDLTQQAASTARTAVNFNIEREAGTFILEGYFREGKGAGFWKLIPSQSFVSTMCSRGYENLTEEDFFSAAVGNVTVKLLEDLKSAGYDRLTFEELFEAAVFNVTPEFISAWRSAGFRNLAFEDLVRLGIFKVTPEFLNEIKAEGFPNLSPLTAIELRVHKIDRDFIRRVKARGFPNVTLDEIIELRLHKIVK